MVISTIQQLNALFTALNKDFRAGRLTFSEYVDGLKDLKDAATVAELPFVFSANDLLRSFDYKEDNYTPVAPYFVDLNQLDAEPSEDDEYSSDLFDYDSEEFDCEEDFDAEEEKQKE